MPKQPVIPALRHAAEHKAARREKFLEEMDAAVPWNRLLAPVEPHYPKAGPKGGRPPMPLETMLRVYFLQNWYSSGDPMAEESLLDSEAMRRFADIELGDDRVPDETTILNFRHLLEKHEPAEKLFAEADAYLADEGITLCGGTLVDATIIKAPSSTKNDAKARDPEMSSTKKGNQWHFGTEAHVGVDAASGIVHSLDTTTAKTHDSQVWEGLLRGDEKSVFADKAYVNSDREEASEENGGVFWGVMRKAPKGGALDACDESTDKMIAKIRARVEHPFRIIKRQFGHAKTRYRGLAKNRAHLFTLFALGNLFPARRRLKA